MEPFLQSHYSLPISILNVYVLLFHEMVEVIYADFNEGDKNKVTKLLGQNYRRRLKIRKLNK